MVEQGTREEKGGVSRGVAFRQVPPPGPTPSHDLPASPTFASTYAKEGPCRGSDGGNRASPVRRGVGNARALSCAHCEATASKCVGGRPSLCCARP
jgi:hypothetical protein